MVARVWPWEREILAWISSKRSKSRLGEREMRTRVTPGSLVRMDSMRAGLILRPATLMALPVQWSRWRLIPEISPRSEVTKGGENSVGEVGRSEEVARAGVRTVMRPMVERVEVMPGREVPRNVGSVRGDEDASNAMAPVSLVP